MLQQPYNKKESSYFCRFTFGQFFTLLVLEIFTLFFIFYLGAHYGGELLGVKSSAAPPVAQKDGLPTLATTNPAWVSTTQDPEVKALAKDIIQSAPTADLKQRVAEMLEESANKKKEETPEPAVATTTVATPPQPQAVIQTAPESARFAVQVGSYPNADEAHAMVSQWKAKGYSAYLTSADIPNKGRWYRVRLGGFDNKEQAQVYLSKLQTQEHVEAFVVTNE